MGVCFFGRLGQSCTRLAIVGCNDSIYALLSMPFCIRGKTGYRTGMQHGFLVHGQLYDSRE
jgi:hypothetical protein